MLRHRQRTKTHALAAIHAAITHGLQRVATAFLVSTSRPADSTALPSIGSRNRRFRPALDRKRRRLSRTSLWVVSRNTALPAENAAVIDVYQLIQERGLVRISLIASMPRRTALNATFAVGKAPYMRELRARTAQTLERQVFIWFRVFSHRKIK